jgi:UDP-glucuronate decarboxylase
MNSKIVRDDIRNIANDIKDEARALAGKVLLISGGSGFLGRYIVATIHYLNRKVLKKPCRVISVDNYITGTKDDYHVNYNADHHDQVEHDIIKYLDIEDDLDFIIHAAGLASPIHYHKYPIETIESAIFGAKNLLELARENNINSFLFFSSSEIYGDPDPNFIPTPETYNGNVSSIGPRSCYDESKRLGETICMTYHSLYGIPIKMVRPFNVYGPGMHQKDYRVVPSFLTKALRGKPLTVHDKGNQTRTFCYISDAVTGFLKVLLSDKNAEVYNVGNDELEINMMSLAKLVDEVFDGEVKINSIPYPKNYPTDEPKRRRPDLTKIRTHLNYSPRVPLHKGLKKTLRWYREMGL